MQHEIIPRLSASVGYFRRVYGNFNVQDNEALGRVRLHRSSASSCRPTRVCEPRVRRSAASTTRTARSPNRNVIKPASDFGKRAIALERRGRLDRRAAPNGVLLQGGFSTGKTMNDNCDIIDEVPEVLLGGAVPTGVMLVSIGAPAERLDAGRVLSPGDAVSDATTKRSAPIRCRTASGSAEPSRALPVPVVAANHIYTGRAARLWAGRSSPARPR